MKKTVLLFFVIAIPALSFAQLQTLIGEETINDKVRFGIKVGIAFSNVQTTYSQTYNPGYEKPGFKRGIIAGGYANIILNKNFIFQPAILMINKGMEEKNQYSSYPTNLNYVELPLNLLYNSTSPKGSFFIGGGPALSYYTGETLFYSGYNELKKLDFGINLLTGYEIPIGFSLNIHYTYGLPNVSGNKEYIPELKNRSIGLAIGYTF